MFVRFVKENQLMTTLSKNDDFRIIYKQHKRLGLPMARDFT